LHERIIRWKLAQLLELLLVLIDELDEGTTSDEDAKMSEKLAEFETRTA